MTKTLRGKTALVTGSSSGIGYAIAEQFAKDGANLVLVARSADILEQQAVKWQKQYGIGATVIVADLSDLQAAQQVKDTLASKGISIDFLVNNAGFGSFGLFQDSDLQTMVAMIRLNVEALTVLTRIFMPDILMRRGKILNVASTAAFQPGPWMAVYYATKAYVLSFSEALSSELEGTGVTVTALCPGPTASGFQDRAVMQNSLLVKTKRLPTAEAVAMAGYGAMHRGRRVYIHGLMNWLMAQSIRFTPRTIVTKLVKYITRPV
jgi:short-subunit dehydrogenase